MLHLIFILAFPGLYEHHLLKSFLAIYTQLHSQIWGSPVGLGVDHSYSYFPASLWDIMGKLTSPRLPIAT